MAIHLYLNNSNTSPQHYMYHIMSSQNTKDSEKYVLYCPNSGVSVQPFNLSLAQYGLAIDHSGKHLAVPAGVEGMAVTASITGENG